MSQVDKALKAFEYTTEWADLIAALGKLNKVLLSHMKYPIIPRRIVISKRLAQCMHPALPSGVHLKALETYDIIFKCMGTNRLAQELFLYSAGLFPLLGHAAMNVRPNLLTVYETHFVPLGERLRPALNGLLAGVLLGLEEGSDHYERTNRLLESVCEAVQPLVFYASLWECIAVNPAIRLAAISFVLKHIDRKVPISDQIQLFGSDPLVIVKAVCAALLDSSVLVQRCALDLLTLALPMHIQVIKFSHQDLVDVMAAATAVLLRRDMSLNRRLYNWLCGTYEGGGSSKSHKRSDSEVSSDLAEDSSIYFGHYSKALLIEAIKSLLQRSLECNPAEQLDLKSYRLIMTLLDKPEVGGVILDHIMIDVLRSLYHHSNHQQQQQDRVEIAQQELVKSANLLFSTLESNYIWEFCGEHFAKASCQRFRISDTEEDSVNFVGSQESTVIEMCALVDFLLDIVSIETYVETTSQHLPYLFKTIISVLNEKIADLTAFETRKSLELAKKLLTKVQPAWNAWDMGMQVDHCKTTTTEVGKEATESLSPPSDEVAEVANKLEEFGVDAAIAFEKVPRAHEVLMKDCIEGYQEFYVTLLSVKAFTGPEEKFDPNACLSTMIKRPQDNLEERTKYLEQLLQHDTKTTSTDNSDDTKCIDEDLALIDKAVKAVVHLSNCSHKFTDALTLANQILVELSSIPTMMGSSSSPVLSEDDDFSLVKGYGCSPQDLPGWLKYLIISSCLVDGSEHPDIVLESINTLLEIISLHHANLRSNSVSEANFIIVMMPLITESQTKCIFKQTVIPQVLASRLWHALGYMRATYHLSCVQLLHHLHSVVPKPRLIEKIIATDLNNVDTYQRFTLLWHLSRDLQLKSNAKDGQQRSSFDICLLKMLDNLNMPGGPLKVLSQSWLVHAMTRGDVGRIMEPLFLTLLDPCTARVSVLHCSLNMLEDQVFAIAFEKHDNQLQQQQQHHDQAVIFHVINDDQEKTGSLKQYSKRVIPKLESVSKACKTARSDLTAINIEINPFALVPPHMDDYDNYTKGYSKEVSSSESSSLTSGSPDGGLAEELVGQILDEVIDTVMDHATETVEEKNAASAGVHPLHSHLLLYTQVSDSRQVLYTLECIKNILKSNARLTICALSTTNLNSKPSARSHQVQILLARHRKSVFGKSFVGPLTSENLATHRNSTLIEVLLATSLYFLRSYYPNLPHLSDDDILANREVQLMAVDLLIVLVSELILVVKDNGPSFAVYINDLFTRCKVQKVVLHSLIASVHDMQKDNSSQLIESFTQDILKFNEVYLNGDAAADSTNSNFSEAFQVQILKLLLALVMLEQVVRHQAESVNPKKQGNHVQSSSSNAKVIRYLSDRLIPDQPMFLAAIVSALKLNNMRHLHSHWTSLVTNCLPFLDHSLTSTVMEVTTQLAANLGELVPFYHNIHIEHFGQVPADYVITQMEALTMMYHFCLIEDSGAAKVSSLPSSSSSFSSASGIGANSSSNQGQSEILSNLLHVFLSSSDAKALMASSIDSSSTSLESARKAMLATLPLLISCASKLWQAVSKAKDKMQSCILVGAPKAVRARILDLLSPIAHHHPVAFLSAVGVTWQEKRSPGSHGLAKNPLPICNADQEVLVDLTMSVKTMPVSIVIQTVRQVLKSPPVVTSGNACKINVEVSVLQFFYAYLAKIISVGQVVDLWSGLVALLRECLALAPPAIFLALAILNQFAQRAPALSERKEQRELQELAGKLIEATAAVGGACLEQTSWMRRNYTVKVSFRKNNNNKKLTAK